ncbi:MAG: hypothetical protein K8T90_03625 [Planctomycetes bacterium]|nr:hypothetical protein [Planctomycetota bacterium]
MRRASDDIRPGRQIDRHDHDGDSPDTHAVATAGRPPRGIHDLPVPVTWDLFGALRRQVQPPLAMTLVSIFDEAVCRTMLDDVLLQDVIAMDALSPAAPLDGRAARGFERRFREFAQLRREWIGVAHEAVGDTGMTRLRVEALALARAAAFDTPFDAATRADVESVLADLGPILSAYGLAGRTGHVLDHTRLRILSSRIDYCLAALLLAHSDASFGALRRCSQLLCAEARVAVTRLRSEIAGRVPTTPRLRVAGARST